MGDISAEPSMEEILSSIKRIIAEEGDGTQTRTRRPARPATTVVPPAIDTDPEPEEVLELSEPMPQREQEPDAVSPRQVAEKPVAAILSQETAAASRGSLDTLSKLVAHPDAAPAAASAPGGEGALDAVVRDMLRPMLREWLDANLPDMVETMVAREIAKITGQRQ